ncbi:coproporphyrinogen dehydrogenase HemZ [Pectinatus cerevisiiphilus]|uniref:Oxygen-independent coproporphyrinogen-3 oxidase n=1 Tax=Pectinatus cerevisiiphilus TaxID=86956 RepID=A0A4R3K9L4_9FIRM|nr:coproporphyrinogen dehydrogenase HemZ [Pectinatus cerevisiiphilus]TCS79724.1 oxygen-independent coproporphyrinogen-3 oxidase [Pectinatus cerevisiiphilus]
MSGKRLIVNKLVINSEKEIVHKIIKEIFLLFKIRITSDNPADYDMIEISNYVKNDAALTVITELRLLKNSEEKLRQRTGTANQDENPRASENRLIKLNLYYLLTEEFGQVNAPWGILHGVRPSKIVHRYISSGMSRENIIKRLAADYAVSAEKAILLTDTSYRQLPMLASSDRNTISIYIGIPFCLTRCLYCSFPSNILPADNVIESFMKALYKEVLSLKEIINIYNLKVQNIYIGGGTPTSLPEKYFARLLKYVKDLRTDDTIEYTVEAGRPDSITAGKIALMLKHAVTRLSVNPQTMQEKTLQLIGRKHTPQAIIDVYNSIRRAGKVKINMDIILGLPGESVADVHDTVSKIVKLNPDDITVHALAIKKGSNLKDCLASVHLPDDETACEMARETESLLLQAGYSPYYLYRQGYMSGQLENTGYCHPGAASTYNIQIMSERQTILGIGGNASTKIVAPSCAYLKTLFNPKDLRTYLQSVDRYIGRRVSLMQEVYGK